MKPTIPQTKLLKEADWETRKQERRAQGHDQVKHLTQRIRKGELTQGDINVLAALDHPIAKHMMSQDLKTRFQSFNFSGRRVSRKYTELLQNSSLNQQNITNYTADCIEQILTPSLNNINAHPRLLKPITQAMQQVINNARKGQDTWKEFRNTYRQQLHELHNQQTNYQGQTSLYGESGLLSTISHLTDTIESPMMSPAGHANIVIQICFNLGLPEEWADNRLTEYILNKPQK